MMGCAHHEKHLSRHNYTYRLIIRLILLSLFLIWGVVTALAQLNRSTETSLNGTQYFIYLPSDYDGSTPYPLLIYLHGAQAMGNDILCSQGKGLPGAIRNSSNTFFDTLQMIVIAPHVNEGTSCSYADNDYEWSITMVDEVVQEVISNYNIDNDRVFGSGISLGAKGIWDYALANPTLFAGLVPISGSAPIDDICTLNQTAIWTFHGEADGLIPISGGVDRQGPQTVVNAINNCFTAPYLPAYLTIFEGKGHNGWDQVYDLSAGYNIYEWMLNLKRNQSSNYTPLIELGPDLTFINPSTSITINSFTFDPNGAITNYNWTQLSGSPLSLINGQPNITVNLGSSPNTYNLQLTVTDNEGNTNSDEITITVTNDTSIPKITELRLYDNDTDIGPITNGQEIDFNAYNMETLDVIATVENLNSKASVKFALNENRNFTAQNDDNITQGYYSIGMNNHKSFNPSQGEYTITATAYGNRNSIDQGASYQVTFSLTENPLPIELIDFKAQREEDGVKLSWTTSAEINNSHFEIYFSHNSTNNWKKIGHVNKSQSNKPLKHYTYFYRTEETTCNDLYFQLKSIDYDGHVDMSNITKLNRIKACKKINVMSNPAQDGYIKLHVNTKSPQLKLQLQNTQGVIIRTYNIDNDVNPDHSLDIQRLAPGVYYLHLLDNNSFDTQKVIIK